MGIKSLSTILNQYSKNGIKYVTLDNFKGKVVSIDTSIYLYKFIYNNSDYLEGFTRQLLRLLKNGIIPLYVFDGKPPEEKKDILNGRKERKEFLVEKKKVIENILNGKTDCSEEQKDTLKTYEKELDGKSEEELKSEMQKLKKKIIYIKDKDIENCKKLFDLFGVPHLTADGEAETFCAVLSRHGYVKGCITEDTDYLASGGDNFMRGFNSNSNSVTLYKIKDILGEMDVTYDQFIDICILCGCDYTTKITGIGAIKAYKFIKKHGTIEQIIESLKTNSSYKVQPNFNYCNARCLLKCENTFDMSGIDVSKFVVKKTSIDDLVNYLKENSPRLKPKFYTEIQKKLDTYKDGCQTLDNSANSKRKQKTITSFFEKRKYFITDEIN